MLNMQCCHVMHDARSHAGWCSWTQNKPIQKQIRMHTPDVHVRRGCRLGELNAKLEVMIKALWGSSLDYRHTKTCSPSQPQIGASCAAPGPVLTCFNSCYYPILLVFRDKPTFVLRFHSHLA